ncbi:MAG: hypothetical protein KA258_02825 [Deltaproteobacteria bacterium]|nr:hypothetical protein [Deltaproteobacteria bacterium]
MATSSVICPAPRYEVAPDLWVIAAYYNPHGYQTRAHNYALFATSLARSGIPLLTVECAFGDEPFVLSDSATVLKLRCQSVLWQKERLLNVAIATLPPTCTKIAWLDADILFERPDWAILTSRLLDRFTIVQVFEQVIRLPRHHTEYRGDGEVIGGFAHSYSHRKEIHLGGHYHEHGHTGFGWAARRDILLRTGLYDTALSGSGDHLIAHAAVGDHESKCIDKVLGRSTPHRENFRRYCDRFFAHTRGLLAATPGTCLHLWHGDHAYRRYSDRNLELVALGFDPARDLRLAPSGAWDWNSDKPELHTWAREYFGRRKEDGGDDDSAEPAEGRAAAAQPQASK